VVYTANLIQDSIQIRIVMPNLIRIRFERKRLIHRSLHFMCLDLEIPQFTCLYAVTTDC